MGWYDNMLPKHPIEGHRGYYPVTSEKEWDELPALYKVMDWDPVKDPHNKDKLTHVKSVIFDVTFMHPYGISAKVAVHPSEVQKLLFCSFKKADCHLFSVCGIELDSGTRLPAKWLQDSTSGAFAILTCDNYVGLQGGFRGHIPEGVKRLDDGTFKYDWSMKKAKISHYELSNPFAHLSQEYIWEPKDNVKEKGNTLDEKIQSASIRAAESHLTDKTLAKEITHEH